MKDDRIRSGHFEKSGIAQPDVFEHAESNGFDQFGGISVSGREGVDRLKYDRVFVVGFLHPIRHHVGIIWVHKLTVSFASDVLESGSGGVVIAVIVDRYAIVTALQIELPHGRLAVLPKPFFPN